MATSLRMVNGKVRRVETLPVTNCDDCGACCRHLGTPPGFASFYVVPEQRGAAGVVCIDLGDGRVRWAPDWVVNSPDLSYWRALPREAEEELAEYYRAMAAGEIADRTRGDDVPCLWYDAATGRCKHYEQRPEVCRDAIQPGDESCLAARARRYIPLPTVPA